MFPKLECCCFVAMTLCMLREGNHGVSDSVHVHQRYPRYLDRLRCGAGPGRELWGSSTFFALCIYPFHHVAGAIAIAIAIAPVSVSVAIVSSPNQFHLSRQPTRSYESAANLPPQSPIARHRQTCPILQTTKARPHPASPLGLFPPPLTTTRKSSRPSLPFRALDSLTAACRMHPMLTRPRLSSSPNSDFYNENGFQKVSRRLREEPLIPLGCIATVAAFTGAYRAMRRGDHQQVQRMFRARVAAQAFTVIAMVAGSWYYAADRQKQKELWKLKEQQDAEEKRQKWIRELEVRDAEDKALQERLEKRKRKKAERDSAAGASDGVAAQAQAAYADAKEKASSLAGDVAPEDPTKSNTTGVRESLPTWLGGSKGADGSSRDKN